MIFISKNSCSKQPKIERNRYNTSEAVFVGALVFPASGRPYWRISHDSLSHESLLRRAELYSMRGTPQNVSQLLQIKVTIESMTLKIESRKG